MIYNDIIFGSVSHKDFEINKIELAARIGAGMDFQNDLLDKCIEEFNKFVSYKFAYARVPFYASESICDFGFASTQSEALSFVLKNSKETIILAVTTGIEIDRLISRLYLKNDPSAFFMDAIGSAAVESLADYVTDKICMGIEATNRFSPGYADFSLVFQKDLLARLNSNQTVGITLNDRFIMTPRKSITAIIGIK